MSSYLFIVKCILYSIYASLNNAFNMYVLLTHMSVHILWSIAATVVFCVFACVYALLSVHHVPNKKHF